MTGPNKITVLIADNDDEYVEQVVRWLSAEPTMEVVGTVGDGGAAGGLARRNKPNVVLMSLDLPGGSGIEAAKWIRKFAQGTAVIMVSRDMSPESLSKVISSRADGHLVKTATRQELVRTIRTVHIDNIIMPGPSPSTPLPVSPVSESRREGQILAVFSPKGGVGSTTVAVNVAMSIRKEFGLQVTLVDGSLPFGDVAVFLDLAPNRSVMDLVVNPEQIDEEYVRGALSTHQRSGTKVLLAPPRPEMAEMVTADQMRRTLTVLREMCDFTVVDTWSCLDERVLTVLELADKILLCFTLDLPAIKSTKVFLEVSELLRFPAEKIVPVLIKSTGTQGIDIRDVEGTIGRPVGAQISNDPRLASRCINEGDPVVLGHAGTAMAQDLRKLASDLASEGGMQAGAGGSERKKDTGRFKFIKKS